LTYFCFFFFVSFLFLFKALACAPVMHVRILISERYNITNNIFLRTVIKELLQQLNEHVFSPTEATLMQPYKAAVKQLQEIAICGYVGENIPADKMETLIQEICFITLTISGDGFPDAIPGEYDLLPTFINHGG
jgi:hypothetical protein